MTKTKINVYCLKLLTRELQVNPKKVESEIVYSVAAYTCRAHGTNITLTVAPPVSVFYEMLPLVVNASVS